MNHQQTFERDLRGEVDRDTMATLTEADSLEDRKGDAIVLTAGTLRKYSSYVGAWLDAGKPAPTPSGFCFVIIEVESDVLVSKKTKNFKLY